MLIGCAGPTGDSYVRNPPPVRMTVSAIAEDAVEKLATLYPPGHTHVKLVYPMDNQGQFIDDIFSTALENRLRLSGFTITPDASLCLAWRLDILPQNIENRPARNSTEPEDANSDWYLRLNLADTAKSEVRTLTRVYSSDGVPIAGFAEQMR